MTHTETHSPWEGSRLIWTANDRGNKTTIRLAPHTGQGQGEPIAQYVLMEHAKFMVNSANALPSLVGALESALELIDVPGQPLVMDCRRAAKTLRAALALAKGE